MAGAVEKFTRDALEGWLDVFEDTVTVTTAQTPILQKNPDRVQATVINLGVADIWARFTTGAVAGIGIRIPASGGILQLVLIEDYMLTAWDLFGIVTSGSSLVFVSELVRVSEASKET